MRILITVLIAVLCLAGEPADAQRRQEGQTSTLPSTARSTFMKLTEVQTLWEESRYDEAIVELEALAEDVRDRPYDFALTNQYLAHTNIMAGNDDGARAALEEALAIPELPMQMRADLNLFYGQLLIGDEEYERALELLEDWLATTVNEPQPGQIFYVAYANYMNGNLERAQPLLEQAIAMQGEHKDQWDRLYYQILFERKLYDQALVVIIDMLDRNPAEDGYWRLLVNHYMQLEASREALAAMAIAHLQNPMDEPADIKRLVSLYGYVEIPEKAARILESRMQDETLPADAETLRQLGDLWLMARERARAKLVLQRAAEVAPDGRTFELLGGIYFEDEDWTGAYGAYQSALEIGGLDEPERVHLLAGVSAYRAGMNPEARSSLEEAAKSDELRGQAESILKRL